MLGATNVHFFDKKNIIDKTIIKIKADDPTHPRIIETSYTDYISKAQRKILKYLQSIPVPDYLYSGIKRKSFIDNGKAHTGKKYVYKLDISKFFPNTSRNKVYHFFLDKLDTSPDVAKILTNLTTVFISDFKDRENYSQIQQFIIEKKIKQNKHLMTGIAPSVILSFLVNIEMFEQIYELCMPYQITMTVYVDDMVFSSYNDIPAFLRKKICTVIRSFGYSLSSNKIEYYNRHATKKITGVIIDKHGIPKTPNSIQQAIYTDLCEYNDTQSDNVKKRLLGRVMVANAIDNSFFALKKRLQQK